MEFVYKPTGVCSSQIKFSLENGIVRNVQFTGGCNGNTQGLSRLAEGLTASELVQRLRGIPCGGRPTSCPDQLARAVMQAVEAEKSGK
ncbi:MAG: TIGR03905 family TSCPD domain-containing protein [Thermoguttaceae bacterium]|nr:TIGR03905 family TSCPD domain-containing protein [Thermoguttaceae bacterium]